MCHHAYDFTPPATHNTARTEIHPCTATQQNRITRTGRPKPHARVQRTQRTHTARSQAFASTANTSDTPCREHTAPHSPLATKAGRWATPALSATRDAARCFESPNTPHSWVSLYFHSRLCQPAPTAAAHPRCDRAVPCQFFTPVFPGNKARKTHMELSSFIALKSFTHFNYQEFSPVLVFTELLCSLVSTLPDGLGSKGRGRCVLCQARLALRTREAIVLLFSHKEVKGRTGRLLWERSW